MMKNFHSYSFLLAACMVIATGGVSFGQNSDDSKPAKSLDDQLLDDLSDDLLDGLDDLSPGTSDAKSELDEKLLEQLGEGEDIGEEADPLTTIARRMRMVEELIAEENTSSKTQTTQKQIVDELAALIEQVRKECECKKGGDSKQASKPSDKPGQKPGEKPGQKPANSQQASKTGAKDSTPRTGKAEDPNASPDEVKRMLKEIWGHLPPKVREQMQTASNEQFLTKYEKLIEEYYKRLAEDKQNQP